MNTEQIDDSRLDLPSASEMDRLAQCPGSLALSRDQPRETNEYAERGTAIHAAIETEDATKLDDDAVDVANKIIASINRLQEEWVREYGIVEMQVFQEKREWIHDGQMPVASVKLDYYCVGRDANKDVRGLCLDAKTGRGAVPSSEMNWQLRTACVALWQGWDCEAIRTAIIQPLAARQPICDYTDADLSTAYQRLLVILHNTREQANLRRPGTHCRYCRARFVCPELRATLGIIKPLTWDAVTPDQKVEMWSEIKRVQAVATDLLSKIEEDVDAGMVPGLIRGPGTMTRKLVGNPVDAASRLGIALRDTVAITEIPFGKFASVVAHHAGLTKKKAEELIEAKLEDMLERAPRRGSIVKVNVLNTRSDV